MSKPTISTQGLEYLRQQLEELRGAIEGNHRAKGCLKKLCSRVRGRPGCNETALLIFILAVQGNESGSFWSRFLPFSEQKLESFPNRTLRLAASVEALIPRLERIVGEIEVIENSIFGISSMVRVGHVQAEELPGPVNVNLSEIVDRLRSYGEWFRESYALRSGEWRVREQWDTAHKMALMRYVAQNTGSPHFECIEDLIHLPFGEVRGVKMDAAEQGRAAKVADLKQLWHRKRRTVGKYEALALIRIPMVASELLPARRPAVRSLLPCKMLQ